MESDEAEPRTRGLISWLGAGVASGLVAGTVFGAMMQVTGVIPKVAALVGRESMLVGWGVHMAIAVFAGVLFALIFGLLEAVRLSAAIGLFYGLVWWLLGGLTLMPLRLGMGLFVFDAAAWQSLAGHLGYGLTLGTVYALVGRWVLASGRSIRRAAAPRIKPGVAQHRRRRGPPVRPRPAVARPSAGTDVEIYRPRFDAGSPADLDLVLAYVRHVIVHGSPQERRCLYEALVHIGNIRTTGHGRRSQ